MNPQLKVQEILQERVRSAEAELQMVKKQVQERVQVCMEAYNKLSRRYELLVNRKRVEKKLLNDYTTKELLGALAKKFVNIFRRQS
jgi:hypothetical protein